MPDPDQLTTRLTALREEYASGTKMLEQLAARQYDLERTMLRIAGAIQVLEELTGDPAGPAAAAAESPAVQTVAEAHHEPALRPA